MPQSSAEILDPGQRAAFERLGTTRSYPKQALIVNEGEESDSLYIVLSGRLKVFVSEDGRDVVLNTLGPGEYFGEITFDGGVRSASVLTLEPTRLVVVPRPEVDRFLAQHPDFALHVIRKLAHRVRALTNNVRSLALIDVYGRVARLLLELAQKDGGRLVIPERLTQREIASRVGASREMVSRILKDLETGGYVEVQRDCIVINRTPPARW